MSDESVTDEQQARTEFERAMRGCRKMVQERMNEKPLWVIKTTGKEIYPDDTSLRRSKR